MWRKGAWENGAVVITGCSSGIGEACAADLAARGLRVFAGVRRESDAQRLRARVPQGLEPVMLDVTDLEMVRSAAATVEEAVGGAGLWGLVNNAGIVVPGPLEWLSVAQLRRQLEVNVLGTHAVTRAMLPLLRRAGGRIVLVGSISGRVAPPYYGAYAASKHALEAMADALRVELRPWGIRVSIVEPDSVATGLWDKLDRDVEALAHQVDLSARPLYEEGLLRIRKASVRAGRGGIPASAVVRAIRHAVCARRPRARYPVGFRARLAVWCASCLPASILDFFVRKAMGLQ